MMRVVSLDFTGLPGKQGKAISRDMAWLQHEDIDVLCCRGIQPGSDGRLNVAISLADELGMTVHYVAGGKQKAGSCPAGSFPGIAILCSHGNRMLRSGTFSLPDDFTSAEPVGQYAVIRQQRNIILVLNLRPAGQAYQKQLAVIADLPIVHRDFAAIILCGYLPHVLPEDCISSHRQIRPLSENPLHGSEKLPENVSTRIAVFEKSEKRGKSVVQLKPGNSRVLCGKAETGQMHARGLSLDLDISSNVEKECRDLYRYDAFLPSLPARQYQETGCALQHCPCYVE